MSLQRGFFAAAALAALCSCQEQRALETASLAAPIINGVVSTDQDYPSSGAILSVASFMGSQFGTFICTGTLIAPDVVLTAGHCSIDLLEMLGAPPSQFYFTFTLDVSQFGMQNVNLPPRTTMVKKLLPHPSYDLNRQPPDGLGENDHDVGLMFLDGEVTDVTPELIADVSDGALITRGSTVAIAGYGQTTPNGQEAGVKYHAPSIVNEVGTKEMQIGDVAPVPQKCHGDSGGPTYMEVLDGRFPSRRLIGITSRAYDQSDCNKGGVDMRADAYRDWIEAEMIAACTDGTRGANACANGGGLLLPGGMLVDAGVRDTGATLDTGFEDAAVIDTGADEPDSGVAADAETPVDTGARPDAGMNTGGGAHRTDEGCSCTTHRAADRSSWAWMLALVALVFGSRRRVG